MRYACLVYFDPTIVFNNSPESNAVLGEAEPARQRLVAAGFTAEALTLPSDAVTVRVREGKTATTDGPFIETKEMLGGLVIIEADDIDAAIRIAAANPMAKLGAIEVRPMVDFSKPRPTF